MKTDIFHLKIISIKDILCHEEYDFSRAEPLCKRLKKEKSLTNPIIVAGLGKDKYLQLDGMNRISAFKMLGIKTILAQIVDYNDQEIVELSSWCHLFYGEKDKFLQSICQIEKVSIKEGKMENVGHRYIKEEGMGRLATVVSRPDNVYLISTNGTLLEKIKRLTKIVSFYKNGIVRDVLPPHPNHRDVEVLFYENPQTNFMLVFPTFTRHQIIEMVKKGGLFPPGVTRHIIKRRCLSINVPLTLFDNKKSLDAKNQILEEMLTTRRFRCYEEPTIFFE